MSVPLGHPERIGQYVIERELGRGGLGVVYLATQPGLNRKVALKVLSSDLASDPEFVERFNREAELLAKLDSPHVITIHDHGTADGFLYLTTQYVAGGDLNQHLKTHGRMLPQTALAVFIQLLEALLEAHNNGVIHRDVKPGNVLVREGQTAPHIYLADFGIAQSELDVGRTLTGVLTGSLAYLAPERLLGSPATIESDLYGAGCTLWMLLTGETPYSGTAFEQATAHTNSPIPQLAETSPLHTELNRLLQWTLAKDPQDRPHNTKDLLSVANDLAAGRSSKHDTLIRASTAPRSLVGSDRTAIRVPAPTAESTTTPHAEVSTEPTSEPASAAQSRTSAHRALVGAGMVLTALLSLSLITASLIFVADRFADVLRPASATTVQDNEKPIAADTTPRPNSPTDSTPEPLGDEPLQPYESTLELDFDDEVGGGYVSESPVTRPRPSPT
ncbi:MAG: serine/threonine protein kinase, partial [Actinomycetales bacterium]|nr:serine/threonine protein kinase [Actinomycetales bacterium]